MGKLSKNFFDFALEVVEDQYENIFKLQPGQIFFYVPHGFDEFLTDQFSRIKSRSITFLNPLNLDCIDISNSNQFGIIFS